MWKIFTKKFWFKCSGAVFLFCIAAFALMILTGAYLGAYIAYIFIPVTLFSAFIMYLARPRTVRKAFDTTGTVIKKVKSEVDEVVDEIKESYYEYKFYEKEQELKEREQEIIRREKALERQVNKN